MYKVFINNLSAGASSIKTYRYGKSIAVLCSAVLLMTLLSTVGSTVSYFTNIEESLGNYFTADPVYFTLAASSTESVVGAPEPMVVVMTPGAGSEPIQYQVVATSTSGDTTLCNSIDVLTTAPFVYNGPLVGFESALSNESGPWAITTYLALNAIVTPSSQCSIKLVYEGWDASSTPHTGYTDTEAITLTFTAPALLPGSGGGDASSTADVSDDIASSTPDVSVDKPVDDTIASTTQETIVPPADTSTTTATSMSP